MSTSAGQPSEEELRAAYEQEIKQVRVEHVLIENVVTLVNLGMRRTGLMPGTEDERDPEQVQLAIETVRAVMPLLEASSPEQANQIRQALSQLQLAYVRIGGGGPGAQAAAQGSDRASVPEPGVTASGSGSGVPRGPAEAPDAPAAAPSEPGAPGPAQRSGRLWVPGQ